MLVLFLATAAYAADDRKVVILFDFVSKFDQGRYGRMLGESVWKKLSRDPSFIVPESMLDVRQYCESHHLQPSPETDLAAMRKIVQDEFGGQIGIWGSVERAAGAESDAYDLVIRCVDFSTSEPKVLSDIRTRTKTVSEIPHVHVKQTLDALHGRQPSGPTAPNALAEENWQKNTSLVVGDFEQIAGGAPKGWEKVCGQQREPLGRLVQCVAEEENSGSHVLHFTLDRNVAENEGVMYYSEPFPVEEGATYRFQCRWRAKGPAVKVFVKCTDAEKTAYRGASDDSKGKEPREVYRSQQNVSEGPVDTWSWRTHTEDFTPRHVKYSPKWGRVMLYAYLSPGAVEFDDVVVKQILPASPGEAAKVRRPSRESPITVEEIEQNERRSREAGRE